MPDDYKIFQSAESKSTHTQLLRGDDGRSQFIIAIEKNPRNGHNLSKFKYNF